MVFTNHPQGWLECVTETKSDELDGRDIGNLIMQMYSIFMCWESKNKQVDMKHGFVTIPNSPPQNDHTKQPKKGSCCLALRFAFADTQQLLWSAFCVCSRKRPWLIIHGIHNLHVSCFVDWYVAPGWCSILKCNQQTFATKQPLDRFTRIGTDLILRNIFRVLLLSLTCATASWANKGIAGLADDAWIHK